MAQGDARQLSALHALKSEATDMKEHILRGDIRRFAASMQAGWEAKKSLADRISTPGIDHAIDLAMSAGAYAAKVSGAGGGGYVILFADPARTPAVRHALDGLGIGRTHPAISRAMERRARVSTDVAPCTEAIVLAGGRGTRLAGVVDDRPKPLAMVAGRPFLAWQLDHLVDQGVRRILLSVGYRAEQVVACMGNAHRQAAIEYVREDVPLGTGGAVRAALARIDGDGAIVLNGDTLAPFVPARLAGRARERLVVSVCAVEDGTRFGAMEVADGIVRAFRARGTPGPALVNAGAYWMARDLLDDAPCAAPSRSSTTSWRAHRRPRAARRAASRSLHRHRHAGRLRGGADRDPAAPRRPRPRSRRALTGARACRAPTRPRQLRPSPDDPFSTRGGHASLNAAPWS